MRPSTIPLLVSFGILSTACGAQQQIAAPPPGTSFSFVLTTTSGDSVALEDLLGRVVLVEFLTTGCTACQSSLPVLNQLVAAYSDQDFVILGVYVATNQQQLLLSLAETPVGFIVLHDQDGVVAEQLQVTKFPSAYLLDRGGRLRYSYHGGLDELEGELTAEIERWLETEI